MTVRQQDGGQELVSEGCVTVAEAARFLHVSRGTVYGLMNSGRLPWVQFLQRGRRIPRRALQALATCGLRDITSGGN
jgi:excisionase family DNA binding protein